MKSPMNNTLLRPVRFMVIAALMAVTFTGSLAFAADASAETPAKETRYLMLDSRIIASTKNAVLRLGSPQKDPKNPLFGETWESRFDNPYSKVIYDPDDKLYKCWYSGFVDSQLEEQTPHENRGDIPWEISKRQGGTCYAYSNDGVVWVKPELGLIESHGNKKNNIVISAGHEVDVIKDARETDPQKRYKAILPGKKSSRVWFSADGIHWKEQAKIQGIDIGDTHNCVFWDESIGKFVLITRTKSIQYGRPGYRQVSRTVSDDFIHWEKAEMIFQGRSGDEQFHDLIVFPYAGVYIGFIGLFDMGIDRQHAELSWSPDCKNWHRIEPGRAFIPNGPVMGDYDWGCIFPAVPVFQGRKTILYYGANNNRFFGWRDGFLARAFLRPDGFAGYEQERAPDIRGGPLTLEKPDLSVSVREEGKTAYVVTKSIPFTGSALCVTADVVPGGGYVVVRVIEAASGKKIAESNRIKNSATDEVLTWKWMDEGFSWQKLKGKDVSLEFQFQNAKLFSFVLK